MAFRDPRLRAGQWLPTVPRVTRLVGLLLFLVFSEDSGAAYRTQLGAPLAWVYNALLDPTPIKLRPFDLIMLAILLVASLKKRRGAAYVAPMRNTLLLVLATTLVSFLYGLAHGGEFRFASWQTYLILSTVLLAFTVAAVFRTAEDFYGLAQWLVATALYRGAMCWVSYFSWGRHFVGASGAFLTTHDDTISWVVSILLLIVGAVEKRARFVTIRNLVLIFFFLGALQWNSRRLAWVSLAMGLVVLYALFPPGAAKRRINRVALFAAPVALLYVVVGWGRQNPIFLPLRSMSTVSTQEDGSTLARNAENLGLIATANTSSFALGTGWGRPYIALTLKYDISGFELWQYVPHNSILGLLAFTGALGFAGFWLAIPTAVFLNSRTARLSSDSKARNVGLVGAAQMIVCANQLYGDMGIFDLKPMYVIAVSYAVALRLPGISGAWGAPNTAPAEPRS
jgi:hypothetical protein